MNDPFEQTPKQVADRMVALGLVTWEQITDMIDAEDTDIVLSIEKNRSGLPKDSIVYKNGKRIQ